jgi:hypothetical protein
VRAGPGGWTITVDQEVFHPLRHPGYGVDASAREIQLTLPDFYVGGFEIVELTAADKADMLAKALKDARVTKPKLFMQGTQWGDLPRASTGLPATIAFAQAGAWIGELLGELKKEIAFAGVSAAGGVYLHLKRLDDIRDLGHTARRAHHRIGPVPGWTSTWTDNTKENAKRLTRSLAQAGRRVNPGQHAHHIVPARMKRATDARALLDKYQIESDEEYLFIIRFWGAAAAAVLALAYGAKVAVPRLL